VTDVLNEKHGQRRVTGTTTNKEFFFFVSFLKSKKKVQQTKAFSFCTIQSIKPQKK